MLDFFHILIFFQGSPFSQQHFAAAETNCSSMQAPYCPNITFRHMALCRAVTELLAGYGRWWWSNSINLIFPFSPLCVLFKHPATISPLFLKLTFSLFITFSAEASILEKIAEMILCFRVCVTNAFIFLHSKQRPEQPRVPHWKWDHLRDAWWRQ